jgi:kynurenine formamidase
MPDSININGRTYEFDLSSPIDISIPLNFNGPQPNAYGVEYATSTPCSAGDLVGDTRKGGSCNFERYTFIPHCNGTHTECVGHVTNERIAVRDCLKDILMTAVLISVSPKDAVETEETYSVSADSGDTLITRASIEASLARLNTSGRTESLIVRTVPNDEEKLTRKYGDFMPPFFTTEAMQFLVELGVRHLIVDLPSIDRLYDEGRLSNHRLFWKVDEASFDVNPDTRIGGTITELAYIPNEIENGLYLLNLQIAPFASDASPSRPILFRLIQN